MCMIMEQFLHILQAVNALFLPLPNQHFSLKIQTLSHLKLNYASFSATVLILRYHRLFEKKIVRHISAMHLACFLQHFLHISTF